MGNFYTQGNSGRLFQFKIAGVEPNETERQKIQQIM